MSSSLTVPFFTTSASAYDAPPNEIWMMKERVCERCNNAWGVCSSGVLSFIYFYFSPTAAVTCLSLYPCVWPSIHPQCFNEASRSAFIMCVCACMSEGTACSSGIPVLSSTRLHSRRTHISSMTAGIPPCVCSCICVTLPPTQQPSPPVLIAWWWLITTSFSRSPLLVFYPYSFSAPLSSAAHPFLSFSSSLTCFFSSSSSHPVILSSILSSTSHPDLFSFVLLSSSVLSSPPIPLFSISSSTSLFLTQTICSPPFIPKLSPLQACSFIAPFAFFFLLFSLPSSSTFTPRSVPATPHLLPPVSSICHLSSLILLPSPFTKLIFPAQSTDLSPGSEIKWVTHCQVTDMLQTQYIVHPASSRLKYYPFTH